MTTDVLLGARAGKYNIQKKMQSTSTDLTRIGAGWKIASVKAPADEAVHQTFGQ